MSRKRKQYLRIYQMLIRYGHSGYKAAEIILDAQRRDGYALDWIKAIFRRRQHVRQPAD